VSELVFLLAAEVDIQAGYEFHEKCQPGRGDLFLRHLDLAFGRIRTFPELAPAFHASYRRLLVHGFPYGIFYAIEGNRIIVIAVLDLRQDPRAIRKRLEG
jgi:toxin ParE1/3/4